jgi:hypothetical protein
VKSNSWKGGGLAFTDDNAAIFTGRCVIQKVERATGDVVDSWGNSRFTVWITDNGMGSPQSTGTDTIAIAFAASKDVDEYNIREIGDPAAQVELGGGNM